jgi:hypothetical protein
VEQEARAAKSNTLKEQARLVEVHTSQLNKLKSLVEEAMLKATQVDQRFIVQSKAFKIECLVLEEAVQVAEGKLLRKQSMLVSLVEEALLALLKEKSNCRELRQQSQIYAADLQQQQRENEHSLMLCEEQGTCLSVPTRLDH